MRSTPDCKPPRLLLAPLRGVTIRTFRSVFAAQIAEAGFEEAVAPFVPAQPGFDPMKDRELAGGPSPGPFRTTPQLIGKDPSALREALLRLKDAGYDTADLNCGCPFPMVRNKGRGSGILRTPLVLGRMLEAGCDVMGERRFSIKARLGVDSNDWLLKLMPVVNAFPLRFLAVHARNARQMYEGECDWEAYSRVADASANPVVPNGDLPCRGGSVPLGDGPRMVGRSFIRSLGERNDIGELLDRYIACSVEELSGERPVLGRMKELVAYWRSKPVWRRRWEVVKISRTVDEFRRACAL